MLYELVLLPIRVDECYELSTEVPLFSSIQSKSPDDCVILGNVVYGDNNVDWFKYKAIEQFGKTIIERIILSMEEIELPRDNWWKVDTPVTVLQTKTFTKDCAYVVRNIQGIRTVLFTGGSYFGTDEQYVEYDNVYHHYLQPIIPSRNEKLNDALMTFIPNSDIDMVMSIDRLNTETSYQNLEDPLDVETLCKDLIKTPYTSISYTKECVIELESLARFINPCTATARSIQDTVDAIKPKFHPSECEIYSTVNKSWILLELLYKLNSSVHTNVKIHYNTANTMAHIEGTSYVGVNCAPDPSIKRLFEMWVIDQIKSMCLGVVYATLEKTYSEEVFIELKCQDKKVVRYYFDLVLFILGSIIA
jgi:hypothetical protein